MPSVVIIPTSAPVWVSAMFVATVVPCRRLSISDELDAGLLAQPADAVDDAARRVVRRRGDLVDGDPARLLVDEDQVGERAADVDADALHAALFRSADVATADDLPADGIHLLEAAVQVGARDLVDAEGEELARPSRAPSRPGRRSRSRRSARPSDRPCDRPPRRGARRSSRSRRGSAAAASSSRACRAPRSRFIVSAMWFAHAAGAQRQCSHASSWSSLTHIAVSTRQLDGVRVAAGLLGAGADVVDRPAHRRGVDADVEHHAVGERAREAQVLGPGRRAS